MKIIMNDFRRAKDKVMYLKKTVPDGIYI